MGLNPKMTTKPPKVTYTGNIDSATGYSNWQKRVVGHLAAVLKGRPIEQVILALKRVGTLEQLYECASLGRKFAEIFSKKIEEHWTPRLTVHLWDRLNLSRRECDDLRHLLSFQYVPAVDSYRPLPLWQNIDAECDDVPFPVLPGRFQREKELAAITAEAGIQVDSFGNCQRNACVAATELYSAYAGAMRKNFTAERPAQPVYLFDGTGQSLGKPLCHAEMGSADFTGDCRQSRKTLQPLQASEGTDHAQSIRDTMQYTADKYNQLIADKEIVRTDGTRIPARPIASADFQAVKAMTATAEQSHSVWCTCQEDSRHRYCKEPILFDASSPASIKKAYKKMLAYVETDPHGPKCHFKTYDDQCKWNHYSPGMARGKRFTKFTCELCGYCPTEKKWRSDVADFEQQTEDTQKARRKAHREVGVTEPEWKRHFHSELFMAPMLHLDFRYIGADMLHLIYLNVFKHIFNYTIHEPMPGVRACLPACIDFALCSLLPLAPRTAHR